MNPLLESYLHAFQSCHPGKKVEIKPAGKRGHWIIIDGDKGEFPLKDEELKFAIENFNRGRI